LPEVSEDESQHFLKIGVLYSVTLNLSKPKGTSENLIAWTILGLKHVQWSDLSIVQR